MTDVVMPRLSDTMQEGTIARWLKQPGETVQRGDVLAQVETDKATMDLEAFESGVLREVLAPEGATVPIGEVVARIGAGGAATAGTAPPAPTAPAPQAAPSAPAPAPAPPAGQAVTSPSAAPGATAPAPSPNPPSPAPSPAPAGGAPPAAPARAEQDGAVRASPLARRIARDHGLDLARIHGSGPEGRVIRADVEAALAEASRPEPAQPAPAAAPPAAGDERVPLSQMRRTIARRMAESTSTVPHFFLTTTVDATDLVRLREQARAQLAAAGEESHLSLNDLVVRAVAVALRRHPEVNVSFDGDALIRHAHVNVGVAVATDRGLIVPVVRDADTRSIAQLSAEIRSLAQRAREGKLQPPDYSGGTFSVSNLGMFGVEQFNAVINPPEAGILAVGAVVSEPVARDGQVVVRDRMKLTLSVDHRALDGAIGARFLQELRTLLEQPLLLLL